MGKPNPNPLHRDLLVQWLLELQPRFDPLVMCEIGTASGNLAEHLLWNVPGLELYCIDYFKKPGHLEAVRKRTKGYAGCHLIPSCSWDGPKHLPEGFQAALIFIDAGHGLESVRKDLAAWWPLVATGGVFCGHDYFSPKNDTGEWGVREAVQAFAYQCALPLKTEATCWRLDKPA